MARTKGAVAKPKTIFESTNENNKNSNKELVEKKKGGRQKGQKIEQNYVIVPLDDNYRVKWDKNNIALQVKINSQNTDIIDDDSDDENDEVKDGWKSILFPTTWKDLGKCYHKELSRKNAIKQSKEKIIEINKLIEVFQKTEKKVINLFGQLDVDESKFELKST